MKQQYEHGVGSFEVTSGKIRVTDPCYEPRTWCAGEFEAPNGLWDAEVAISDEGSWGRRVASVTIWHRDSVLNKHVPAPGEQLKIDVGVDSGQAGFFDAEKYVANQGGEYGDLTTFYGQACAATYNEEKKPNHFDAGIVMGFGVNASSGYGDGSYNCYVSRDKDGNIVAARIYFLDDPHWAEDDDSDYDDSEDNDEDV